MRFPRRKMLLEKCNYTYVGKETFSVLSSDEDKNDRKSSFFYREMELNFTLEKGESKTYMSFDLEIKVTHKSCGNESMVIFEIVPLGEDGILNLGNLEMLSFLTPWGDEYSLLEYIKKLKEVRIGKKYEFTEIYPRLLKYIGVDIICTGHALEERDHPK